MDVLRKHGDLDWGRCTGTGLSPQRPRRPPCSVWRYRVRDPRRELAISTAVEGFTGKVDWEIVFTGRNWVVAPTRIRDYQESHGIALDVIALDHIATEDPGLVRDALEDLPRLAAAVASALQALQ